MRRRPKIGKRPTLMRTMCEIRVPATKRRAPTVAKIINAVP
jgi:hypothetical protein